MVPRWSRGSRGGTCCFESVIFGVNLGLKYDKKLK